MSVSNEWLKTYKTDRYTINVLEPVYSTWMKFKQVKSFQKETCGVLIGSYDFITHEITIEVCTSPFKKDISKRFSFTLKDLGHQKVVDAQHNKSAGESFYLGTWHTHPESNPTPSTIDVDDWNKCVIRNPQIPIFLFVIVGIDKNYFEVRTNNKFEYNYYEKN